MRYFPHYVIHIPAPQAKTSTNSWVSWTPSNYDGSFFDSPTPPKGPSPIVCIISVYKGPIGLLCYSFYMISRRYRIAATLFPGVLRGKTTQNELFRVVIKTDTSLKVPKYAVIVPTKLAKTAVLRNRVRRVVYAALASYTLKNQPAFYTLFPKKVIESVHEAEQGLKNLL